MKVVKLKVGMSTDRVFSKVTGEIEVELKNGMTEDQIEDEYCAAATVWALENMNLSWEEI